MPLSVLHLQQRAGQVIDQLRAMAPELARAGRPPFVPRISMHETGEVRVYTGRSGEYLWVDDEGAVHASHLPMTDGEGFPKEWTTSRVGGGS